MDKFKFLSVIVVSGYHMNVQLRHSLSCGGTVVDHYVGCIAVEDFPQLRIDFLCDEDHMGDCRVRHLLQCGKLLLAYHKRMAFGHGVDIQYHYADFIFIKPGGWNLSLDYLAEYCFCHRAAPLCLVFRQNVSLIVDSVILRKCT